MKKNNLFINILENFVLIMIILVLIQTFMEDLSVYLGLNIKYINLIKLSAVIFDAFFTLEFLIRMIAAIAKKEGIDYFFYKNGWIDLLASIPLLLLLSGPELIYQVWGINILSVLGGFAFINTLSLLKIIKAIRVARILRLLRVLKIFGKIKNVNSVMAQRQICVISTIIINTIIIFFITNAVLYETNIFPSKFNESEKKESSINNFYYKANNLAKDQIVSIINTTALDYDNIYRIVYNGNIIYESDIGKNNKFIYMKELDKKSNTVSNDKYLITYKIFTNNKLYIKYHRLDVLLDEVFNNMLIFSLIIIVLLSILIIYSRHFALTISDPVFVMRNGFEKKDYTLAVKLKKHYLDQDVFLLANDYNNRWLPAKIRKLSELKEKGTKLKLEDIIKK